MNRKEWGRCNACGRRAPPASLNLIAQGPDGFSIYLHKTSKAPGCVRKYGRFPKMRRG